jgi:hypothetical protein
MKVWLRRLIPLLAFALLAWVLHKHGGVQTVIDVVEQVGWNWPWLIMPVTIIGFITIVAYRVALPNRGREVPIWPLVQIERAGTALNSLLPFGNNSSHIIKIGLLRRWYSSEEIASAGVWCAVASGASNFYTAIGPLVCLAIGVGEPKVVALLLLGSIVMALPMTLVLAFVGKGLSIRVARLIALVPLRFVRNRQQNIIAWAERLDKHVATARTSRKADFAWLMFYRLLSQTVRVGEIWLAIELLNLPGGLWAALLYNAVNRAVLQIFVVVPGRIGIMEGTSALAFEALGYGGEAGLALALALRFRWVAKVVVGFTALSSMPALAEKYPPPPNEEDEPVAEAGSVGDSSE